MSLKGQSFSSGTGGAYVTTAAGNAASVYAGAFTIAVLMKMSSSNVGLFGGWSGGVGGTERGGMLMSSAKLFGMSDFSSGYGGPFDDGVWRWYVMSKAAGSAHYRMHVADLATLTWGHAESTGAGNHADTGTSDALTLGLSTYALGFATADWAAGAVWLSALSDAAIEAACTQLANDLAGASPAAGWLAPEATAGTALTDFTGGGADETARQTLATSPDPADFDFSLGHSAPLGVAAETDTALPLGRVKRRALGVAVETATAVALGRRKLRALGVASETSTAMALGGAPAPPTSGTVQLAVRTAPTIRRANRTAPTITGG